MATEDTKKICSSLVAIMADVKAIGKDSKNTQQGFMFRGIDAVMNHLHPIFVKHKVVILPEVLEERSEERKTKSGGNLIYRILKIRFNFIADDGSQVSSVMVGEGMDSGDKAANKAMAVALKYALSQMLLLPYDEVDPDSESHQPSEPVKKQVEPARPAQAKEPAWIIALKENAEYGKMFKETGLNREDGPKLWNKTDKSLDIKKRNEQFYILIDENHQAMKANKESEG